MIRPNHGERYWEVELYRPKGELLPVQISKLQTVGFREKAEEAEVCFQQAIDTARELSAKPHGLRATTSLARLSQQQSK